MNDPYDVEQAEHWSNEDHSENNWEADNNDNSSDWWDTEADFNERLKQYTFKALDWGGISELVNGIIEKAWTTHSSSQLDSVIEEARQISLERSHYKGVQRLVRNIRRKISNIKIEADPSNIQTSRKVLNSFKANYSEISNDEHWKYWAISDENLARILNTIIDETWLWHEIIKQHLKKEYPSQLKKL